MASDPLGEILQIMRSVPKKGDTWFHLFGALKSFLKMEMARHPEWVWVVEGPASESPPDQGKDFYACGDYRLSITPEGVLECMNTRTKAQYWLNDPQAFFASLENRAPQAVLQRHVAALDVLSLYGNVEILESGLFGKRDSYYVSQGSKWISLHYWYAEDVWEAVLVWGAPAKSGSAQNSAAQAWTACLAKLTPEQRQGLEHQRDINLVSQEKEGI